MEVLRFGHSPDPDDAFMFYGFAAGGVQVELRGDAVDEAAGASSGGEEDGPGRGSATVRRYRVEHVLEDIQSLNERALRGELEITAVSAHAYPFVADKYWVMRTGVSMGDGYGPLVVARRPAASLAELRGARIAVPGLLTTGMLVLKLFLEEFRPVLVPFDQILETVAEGRADAGVVIHEGQLTWPEASVHKVADLGELWKKDTGLPLPLGLDLVRKDLGLGLAFAASAALRRSIEFAQANREEAMRYALQFGRGLDATLGDRFVGMYVNDWTLDMGEPGRRALRTLLDRASDAGLTPQLGELRLV